MGFPRQEYWSDLPFPSPGNRPHLGIKPVSPRAPVLAGGFFTTGPPGKPQSNSYLCKKWEETLSTEKERSRQEVRGFKVKKIGAKIFFFLLNSLIIIIVEGNNVKFSIFCR